MGLMGRAPAVLRLWRWALLWLMTALAVPVLAQGVQPVPALTARVMDQTGTLAAGDVAALEAQLQAFEQRRGTQIVVLVVRSTAPEDIADYTQRVAEAWKLGRARVGDGLLLVVAVQDRRVRIAPYKALEGAVPDVLARRIIDEQMVPAFRQGDYAGGLRKTLTQLQGLITGEALPPPSSTGLQDHGFDLVEAAILLLVAVPMVAGVMRQLLGRRLGALAGAALAGWLVWQISGQVWMALLAGLIGFFGGLLSRGLPSTGTPGRWRRSSGRDPWGGSGWGHGGFGGGGGGGFGGGFGGGMSSGGGGDAGGGGASGSW